METDSDSQNREIDGRARDTYGRFMSISKWAVIFVVVVLLLMAMFMV